MTSASTFPKRLTKIDDLARPDHAYLTKDDECYFLGEYTARKGFAFSATNGLIVNFKKRMDRRGKQEWQYKEKAIRTAAEALQTALTDRARETVTFVPVPPSKAKTDSLYDDRLVKMLRLMWPGQSIDLREVVTQPISTSAVHDNVERPTPAQLRARYVLDRSVLQPAPQLVAVVDDVITTGAHFVAIKGLLRAELPTIKVVGLFIARRVPEAADIEDFEGL